MDYNFSLDNEKLFAVKCLFDETQIRSSRPEVFCKNRVLRNFTKFTRKHLCQSLFFNKVAGIKKETLAQIFSCGFCEISKNTFFTEHLLATASLHMF